MISDSNYVRCPAQRLDPSKTVFVGALHGMLNAEALASIMNDLFGGVMYAGIDTDKHKYPIGELLVGGRGGVLQSLVNPLGLQKISVLKDLLWSVIRCTQVVVQDDLSQRPFANASK